jgi:valyl-tRNA synthetase
MGTSAIKSTDELPKRYNAAETEAKWQRFWEDNGVFRFNREAEHDRIFSVDTPPPTVSGALHIGHVYSYTQADFIVRYQRMRGRECFYPFGFDDNGLATERLVERVRKVKAFEMAREDFIKLCLEVSREQEAEFKDLWQAVGISCDWTEEYTTINDVCRRLAQRSFLDLNRRGHVYRKEAPSLWCPQCRTAIAQAEIEDHDHPSEFHEIVFTLDDGTPVNIATTRPELLPACVAVFAHSGDERYAPYMGRKIRTPHFNAEVQVMADDRVDPEKGTGIVMCCTFGDTTDIDWWQGYGLDTKVCLDEAGRLNELAGEFAGMPLMEGRKAIVAKLREEGLLTKSWKIEHTVNCHERCGTPLEFIVTPQWFIRLLDKKDDLIAFGAKCRWFPEFMGVRYRHWVENLRWDWCVSRQRYYGVPFPVWYCRGCGAPIFAHDEDLPVNPLTDKPPVKICPHCDTTEFRPEHDVFDTWMTSSLTPQINAKWGEPDDRMAQLFPLTLRPQAHDIIRTWAFYTITKAYLHEGNIPWDDVMISGHAQDIQRRKISKSKSKTVNPRDMITQFSADAVRYWAGSVKLGADTFIDLQDPRESFEGGKRLVTKLYNAAKLAHAHLLGFTPQGNLAEVITHPIDRWLLKRLADTTARAASELDAYEYSEALAATERFFWNDFCDNYLEIAKCRLYGDAFADLVVEEAEKMRASALQTLHLALEAVLKMFAPFTPHITEEVWHWHFAAFSDKPSIHLAPWPDAELFASLTDAESEAAGNDVFEALALARKAKSELNISIKKQAKKLTIGFKAADAVDQKRLANIKRMQTDLLNTANADELELKAEVLAEGYELDESKLKAQLELHPAE